MALLELLTNNNEFLLDDGGNFILADTDNATDCCCGGVDCSFECDCESTFPPLTPDDCLTPSNFYLRIRSGDFDCTDPCGTGVTDSFTSCGGGIGGSGIPFVRTGGSICCSYGAPCTISVCDCANDMLTPCSMTMQLTCVEYQGQCRVRVNLQLCNFGEYVGYLPQLAPTKDDPAILVQDGIGSGVCCNFPELELAAETF